MKDTNNMVHIRIKHPVSLYTPKSQPENHTDRLVKLVWKSNEKTGRVAHSSRCLSLPIWQPSLDGIDRHYLPMLVDAFETVQTQMVHKYVTSKLDAGEVVLDVPASEFEPAKVLETWEVEAEDGRGRNKLTAPAIEAWFKTTLEDTLMLTLAERQGLTNDMLDDAAMVKLQQQANGYNKVLQLLAEPKNIVSIDQAKLLSKALAIVPEEVSSKDAMWNKLSTKVTKILNPKVTDDVLASL